MSLKCILNCLIIFYTYINYLHIKGRYLSPQQRYYYFRLLRQTAADIHVLDFYLTGFDFDLYIVIIMSFCMGLTNFIKIKQRMVEF